MSAGFETQLAQLAAPVKLTLALRVLGLRADGFHDLEGLCVRAAPPADTVSVRRVDGDGLALVLTGPAAAGLPTDHTNLAVRAATRYGARGVEITVHKEIPAGSGLGGGSADAAAVLLALQALADEPLTAAALDDAAAAVGSDVPVCLRSDMSWMRGRGEIVDDVGPTPPLSMLIVTPPFGCSTPAVYRAWDGLGGPVGEVHEAPAALRGQLDELRNDLEPAALRVEPRLLGLRQAIVATTGRAPLLAGSGSSYVVLLDAATGGSRADAPNDAEAADLVARLADATGARVWLARSGGSAHDRRV